MSSARLGGPWSSSARRGRRSCRSRPRHVQLAVEPVDQAADDRARRGCRGFGHSRLFGMPTPSSVTVIRTAAAVEPAPRARSTQPALAPGEGVLKRVGQHLGHDQAQPRAPVSVSDVQRRRSSTLTRIPARPSRCAIAEPIAADRRRATTARAVAPDRGGSSPRRAAAGSPPGAPGCRSRCAAERLRACSRIRPTIIDRWFFTRCWISLHRPVGRRGGRASASMRDRSFWMPRK